MKPKRVEWIDIAKGIGIILVVLGHVVNKSDVLHKVIFSFHMPFFFFLSGYLFRPEKYSGFGAFVADKARRLLVPYVIFFVIGLLFSTAIPEWRAELSVKGLLIDLYLGYPEHTHITSTWFLISLFIVMTVYYVAWFIAGRLPGKGKGFMAGLTILAGLLGYAIYLLKIRMGVQNGASSGGAGFLPGGRLPLTIDASFMAFVFFVLGLTLRKKIDILNKIRKFWGLLFVVCTAITVFTGGFLNTRVNIHGCSYGNILYFFLAAASGIMTILLISKGLEAADADRYKIVSLIKKIFLFYGRNTIVVLGLQSLFVNIMVFILNRAYDDEYQLFENVPAMWGMAAFGIMAIVMLPLSIRLYDACRGVCVK